MSQEMITGIISIILFLIWIYYRSIVADKIINKWILENYTIY